MRIEKNSVDLVCELMEIGREYIRALDRVHAVAPYGVDMCGKNVECRKASALINLEKYSERVSVYTEIFRVDAVGMFQRFWLEYDNSPVGVTEEMARRWLKECKI